MLPLTIAASRSAKAKRRHVSPNEKLNIAVIACGGRGGHNLGEVSSENIVALCDVDENILNAAAARHPKARKYSDFRKLFNNANDIDAVVVSTPAHTHAFATLPALQLGKHVYCEKPLAHTVWECRMIAEAAAKAKVVTQMGTQIHATENYRRVVELIQCGAIGGVSEVHVWVDRAWGDAMRPKETPPIPANLNWDLWIGPAPMRPYHPIYFTDHPRWYPFWDFGGGTLPDLGSHWNDLPFWALKLRHPLTVEPVDPRPNPESAPASMAVTYQYGARGEMPPVKLTWHQGENKPDFSAIGKIPNWGSGVLFIGSKGQLLADYGRLKLLPEENFRDFKPLAKTIPESIGHWKEWIAACKTGAPTTCNFDYSGALSEANQLGLVAYRLGKKIEWDAKKLKAKNCPEADQFIRHKYRKGWKLA